MEYMDKEEARRLGFSKGSVVIRSAQTAGLRSESAKKSARKISAANYERLRRQDQNNSSE